MAGTSFYSWYCDSEWFPLTMCY